MTTADVTRTTDVETAVRTGHLKALMEGFETDAPINTGSELSRVVYELAEANAACLYLDGFESDEEREYAEKLDGFLADLYFILTRCRVTLPDGEEF